MRMFSWLSKLGKNSETKLKRFLYCRTCQSIYYAHMHHKPL